jgi:hypothetical protein
VHNTRDLCDTSNSTALPHGSAIKCDMEVVHSAVPNNEARAYATAILNAKCQVTRDPAFSKTEKIAHRIHRCVVMRKVAPSSNQQRILCYHEVFCEAILY